MLSYSYVFLAKSDKKDIDFSVKMWFKKKSHPENFIESISFLSDFAKKIYEYDSTCK